MRVRQISTPGRERTISVLSRRITSIRRASLPCSAASAIARSLGSTPASDTISPSALETTLWAIDEHVARARARPRARRRGEQRGEIVAGADLGDAGQRARDDHGPLPHSLRRAPLSSRDAAEHAARMRGAAAAGGERDAQRLEVVRGVDVDRKRLDVGDVARHARVGGRLLVAGAAVGPEGGLDRVGRHEHERVRAACRGGRERS